MALPCAPPKVGRPGRVAMGHVSQPRWGQPGLVACWLMRLARFPRSSSYIKVELGGSRSTRSVVACLPPVLPRAISFSLLSPTFFHPAHRRSPVRGNSPPPPRRRAAGVDPIYHVSPLAGTRRRRLHRAVRVTISEVLPVVALVGLD